MAHTRMFHEYPISLVKLLFFFIQVKIIQVLDFDNRHLLNHFILSALFLVLTLVLHEADMREDKLCLRVCRLFFSGTSPDFAPPTDRPVTYDLT